MKHELKLGAGRTAIAVLAMLALHAAKTADVIAADASKPNAPRVSEAMRLAVPQKAPLVSVHRHGRLWVAVGDYGTILLSGDGGATWTQARSVPFSGLLTAVTMVDERVGWAVGHGGTILRTDDGGQQWRLHKQVEGAPVLLSVLATDARHVLVVGAYGTALATSDGGASWTAVRVAEGRDGDRHLNHAFLANGVTYLTGEGGAAYRSKNGWQQWEALHTGVTGSLWGGLATRGGDVVLFGMSGRVLQSRDQGVSWKTVDTGLGQSLTDAVQLDDGRLVVVGNGGALAVGVLGGADGGLFKTAILPDRANIHAVLPKASGALALFGAYGVVEHAVPQ